MAELNFTYAEETSLDQITAFETAGRIWSKFLKDDVSVNIHVELTDKLDSNVIGGALPGMISGVKYKDLIKQMKADVTSANDKKAVSISGSLSSTLTVTKISRARR